MKEYNKEMADYITSWGLPRCLEEIKDDIIFKFDDDNLLDDMKKGYHCRKESVGFCLYNSKSKDVLFTLEFQRINRCPFGDPVPRIKLHLIYTHIDAFRRKGIASYYMSKLIEFAINQDIKCISLTANADNSKDDNNHNALNQKELKMFYKKRSTEDMRIEIFSDY